MGEVTPCKTSIPQEAGWMTGGLLEVKISGFS